jgi:hypothetical protein
MKKHKKEKEQINIGLLTKVIAIIMTRNVENHFFLTNESIIMFLSFNKIFMDIIFLSHPHYPRIIIPLDALFSGLT